MAFQLTKSTITRGVDEVYVAAMPLRAAQGPPQMVMSIAYSLNFWDLQHFMVVVKPCSQSQVFFFLRFILSDSCIYSTLLWATVFDFQPKDPESIYTALDVLSGRPTPGTVLVRKLTNIPRRRCWLVGTLQLNAVDAATKFNSSWETNLRVGHHDCRNYTNGLVEHLTGEKNVLHRITRGNRSEN